MTRTEALKAISRLRYMTGGKDAWDEATTAAWAEQVATLDDPDAAQETTMQIVRTWTNPGVPPFAVWLQAYQRVRERRIERNIRPAIGSPMNAETGPKLYLDGLMDRARQGSTTAITELGNWWRGGAGKPFLDLDELNALGVDTRERHVYSDGTVRHLWAVQ